MARRAQRLSHSDKFGGVRALLRGDGFVVLTSARGLKFAESVLAARCQYKWIGLFEPQCED